MMNFYKGVVRGIVCYCGFNGQHDKCVDCVLHDLHVKSGCTLICRDVESYPKKYIKKEGQSSKAMKEGRYIKHSDGSIETTQLMIEGEDES